MAVVVDKPREEAKHETERFVEEIWRRCVCIGVR